MYFVFVSGGCVYIADSFNMVPINSIPIIPTALARNLLGPTSLSEIQSQVKTG